MIFLDIFNGLTKSKQDSQDRQDKLMIAPVEIDISKAERVHLPQLKFERSIDTVETVKQDWEKYYSITQKAHSHYNRKWYAKSKEEWLSIYDWYHRDHMYYTYLMRTYRKLIDYAIMKKKYQEAFNELSALFEKCSNYANTDIKKYNKVIALLNKLNNTTLPEKELLVSDEPEFVIESDKLQLLEEVKKPRVHKIEQTNGTSILDLKARSEFLPESLPHISFNENGITYSELASVPFITNDTYRFRECSNLSSFISSSREQTIYYYNWSFELLGKFNAFPFSKGHTYLRCIEASADQSCIFFTVIDKAYVLDANMNLLAVWQVPHKDGYEKRKVEGANGVNEQIKSYVSLLELPDKPSKEEIKTAFRKQVIKWHPDRNPDNPQAEEKTKQLIQAYEFLSGEDVQSAFEGFDKDEYYWVDLSRSYKIELGGLTLELNFTLDSGEDWIYGAGISDDASRIFLGCYSGKIYQINSNGLAEKIYIVPEYKKGVYGTTNPISFVTEYNARKYILTHWYLYVLNNDKTKNYLKNDSGNYRLFEKGIILQDKKRITLFDIDGNNQGTITFKSPIKQVCFFEGIFLIETTTKSFTFKYI